MPNEANIRIMCRFEFEIVHTRVQSIWRVIIKSKRFNLTFALSTRSNFDIIRLIFCAINGFSYNIYIDVLRSAIKRIMTVRNLRFEHLMRSIGMSRMRTNSNGKRMWDGVNWIEYSTNVYVLSVDEIYWKRPALISILILLRITC